MKKLMSLLLAAALILTTVGGLCISVSADETDITIADFSVAGGAANFGAVNGYKHADNMTSEVTRTGKDYSLKWTNFHEKANADDNTGNSRIQTPNFTTVGEVLNHKYFNAWIYSAVANGQQINLYMFDRTTGGNAFLKSGSIKHKITVDWTGWKLVSIPFDDTVLADFNNSTTEAQETDNVYMWLQPTGFGTTALNDSILYIDSIWLSSSDPTIISQTDEVTFSVENNKTDVSKSQKQYIFTANKAFAYGVGNLNDYTEVKINGTALTAGADYTVQQEHNVLYVTLNSNLPDGASCSFGLKAGTPFADDSSLATAFTSTFTAKSDFFMIGDFSKYNGFKNWRYSTNIKNNPSDAPYESDEVTMSGKDYALKWDKHQKDEANYNTRVQSPDFSDIGKLFKYDKLGAWIYSDKANGQLMNILINDTETKQAKNSQIKIDWTGWKLVNLDLTGFSLNSFYNATTNTTANATDNWYLWYQTEGFSVSPLSDTLLYIDSIFLYNDDFYNSNKDDIVTDFSQNDLNGWFITSGKKGNVELDTTVKKDDGSSSAKWSPVEKTSEFSSVSNVNGLKLGDVLDKDYINLWVYSTGAEDQKFNLYFYDKTLNTVKVASGNTIKGGLSNWQLVSINVSSWTLDTFNKTDGTAADKKDSIQFVFNIGGWSTDVVSGIELYFDSIWLSDESEVVSLDMTSTIADGSVVSSATKAIGFIDFPIDFTVGKDYSDKITVKCNDAEVAKSEYKVQQEGNSIYVVFTNGLTPGASYSVTMSAINMLNKSYSAKTVNFTTQAAHYDLTYSFGADGSMTALPEDGSVQANAKLTNATAADTTARIITAVYDKDGNLVTAGISESVTVKKGKSATLSKTVTAESYADCTVKCYVWQWDSLVPYSGEIGQL